MSPARGFSPRSASANKIKFHGKYFRGILEYRRVYVDITTGSDNLHESDGDRSIGFSVSTGSSNEFPVTNTRTHVGK